MLAKIAKSSPDLISLLRAACRAFVAGMWWASLYAADLDVREVGTWPGLERGLVNSIVVANNYAYLAGQGPGLVILDVRNPAKPERVGGYNGSFQDLAMAGHY